jgi:hypothetical protein
MLCLLLCIFGAQRVAHAGEQIAHYRFDTNGNDSLGKGPPFAITNGSQSRAGVMTYRAAFAITNPPITNGVLFVDGRYDPNGHFVHYLSTETITNLRYDSFTVSLDFYPLPPLRSEFHLTKLESKIDSWTRGAYVRWRGFDSSVYNTGNILTGGYEYRWMDFHRENGVLTLTLNNHSFTHGFSRTAVKVNRWHNLICSVDLQRREILTEFDGQLLEPITLPADFKLEAAAEPDGASDRRFTFVDGSQGSVYYGYAANLKIMDGALGRAELHDLYARSVAERPKFPKPIFPWPEVILSIFVIAAMVLVLLIFVRRRRRLPPALEVT